MKFRGTNDGLGCPGEGTCHGPMGWCPNCGDVDKVCPDETRQCMAHFCLGCSAGPTSIRDYTCDGCRDQEALESLEERMLRAEKRGDTELATKLSEQLARWTRGERAGGADTRCT